MSSSSSRNYSEFALPSASPRINVSTQFRYPFPYSVANPVIVSPETHLLASWIVAAKTTRNLRDCRLVVLAGILPDADGLGLLVDWFNQWKGGTQTALYAEYHHWLMHGAFGAVVVAGILTAFARDRWRVALLALAMFHLHLLCDLLGSRGPSPRDLWPIYYLGPFSRKLMLLWKGQWRLDRWQNRYFSAALLLWSLWIASKFGHSFLGVFNRKLDAVFSGVLVKWRRGLEAWFVSASRLKTE